MGMGRIVERKRSGGRELNIDTTENRKPGRIMPHYVISGPQTPPEDTLDGSSGP